MKLTIWMTQFVGCILLFVLASAYLATGYAGSFVFCAGTGLLALGASELTRRQE